MATVGVIGSGSWGTALALVLAENGHRVLLYGRNAERIETMRHQRENRRYLAGHRFPEQLTPVDDFESTVLDADYLLLAVPTRAIRETLQAIKAIPKLPVRLISVTKGIEVGTLMRIEQIADDVFGDRQFDFVCLSGPSHAEEVARKIPTTIVAASVDAAAATAVQDLFMAPMFRVYTHSDIIGVELGGALKNIIAVAAGICDGVKFGDNTKAALMTRGLAEMTRLGVAMGADAATFSGLSGIGDLIVTCMSRHSRNRYVGEQIGLGRSLEEVLSEMVMVAEGVTTTESTWELARRHNIELPITNQVHRVLFEGASPREAVASLMQREAKAENS